MKKKKFFQTGGTNLNVSALLPNAETSNDQLYNDPEKGFLHKFDLLNYIIGSQGDPRNTQIGKAFLSDPSNRNLYTAASIFNQRPEVKSMSPQERVKLFYDLKSDNPEVQKFKEHAKSIGYGIEDLYSSTRVVDLMKQQGRPVPNINFQNGGAVLVSDKDQAAGYNKKDFQKHGKLEFPAKFSGQFRFFTPAEIPVMATDQAGNTAYLGPGSKGALMQGNVTEKKMQVGGNFFSPANNFQSAFEPMDMNIPQMPLNQELELSIPKKRTIEGFYQPMISGVNTAANLLAQWKNDQDYQKYYDQNWMLNPGTTYLNKRQRFGDTGLPQAGLGMMVANESLQKRYSPNSPNERFADSVRELQDSPLSAPSLVTGPVNNTEALPTAEAPNDNLFKVRNGEDRATAAYRFFTTKGLSPEHSAGIVGNLIQESGLKTTAVGDGGKAKGIAQWHPDRWSNVQRYLRERKLDPNSYEGQLEGVWFELNTNEKAALDRLKRAKTVEQAAELFNKYYERSADKTDTRANLARNIYNRLASFSEGGTYLLDDHDISELQKIGYKLTILD